MDDAAPTMSSATVVVPPRDGAVAQAPDRAADPALDWPPMLVRRVAPQPLPDARLLWRNDALLDMLGLASADRSDERLRAVCAGERPWPGQAAEPMATAYAGHQFGAWTAALGDGRVLTLARVDTPAGSQEVQLKGAGATPFARGSDGRAVLRSTLREALACEALHALGVPTTRALAIVGSALSVEREGRPEPTAVLARCAASHARFGHFEWLARGAPLPPGLAAAEAPVWRRHQLAALADALIARHDPDLAGATGRHGVWLTRLAQRHARLVAQWQVLGFCHGVLNTDNCSVLGLTLDYGPFGFLERFRPHHVCNASDTEGRYHWAAQPAVMRWNLERLLEACAPLLAGAGGGAAVGSADAGWVAAAAAGAQADILRVHDETLASALRQRWSARLGLPGLGGDGSRPDAAAATGADHRLRQDQAAALCQRWLGLLQRARADFTLGWRALADAAADGRALRTLPAALSPEPAATVAPAGAAFAAVPDAAPPAAASATALPASELAAALGAWQADWQALRAALGVHGPADHARLLAREPAFARANPAIVLRNHAAQTAIEAAHQGDLGPFHHLMGLLADPWRPGAADAPAARPPTAAQAALEIGCSA